jgi:hypothetical protein
MDGVVRDSGEGAGEFLGGVRCVVALGGVARCGGFPEWQRKSPPVAQGGLVLGRTRSTKLVGPVV